MKYNDCPTATASIVVHASAATVWEIISDIESPTRFSTEVKSVEWVEPGTTEPTIDAHFVGHSAHEAIGEWETTCKVTDLRPEHVFEWSVVGADDTVSSIWRFTITDRGDGVELEQGFQMGPGRSGLNIAIDRMPDKEDRIVERRLAEHQANMERTLAGIKAVAESRVPGEIVG